MRSSDCRADRIMLAAGLVLFLLVIGLPLSAHAQGCAGSADALRLDWSDTGWKTGSLGGTFTAGRLADSGEGLTEPVTVTLSGSTNRLKSGYPAVSSEFTGGRGGAHDSFALQVDFGSNQQSLTLQFDFARPVDALSFDVFDIDYLPYFSFQRGFRDGLTITGVGQDGGTVRPALRSPHVPAGQNTSDNATVFLGAPLSSNQVVGYRDNSAPGSDAGNVNVRFSQPVTSVRIEYTNGLYAPSPNPQQQAVAVSDLEFCVALAANLQATKKQRVISQASQACGDFGEPAEPGTLAAIPGACIEYRIQVTNTGSGAAGDLTLEDELDKNLEFRGAMITGFQADGPEFGLTTPATGQDCALGRCLVSLAQAALAPGATGEVVIRATVR